MCCRYCSLLSWKEDIISSLLSPHAVGVTMGTWELLCSGACFIVLRDNSCLYLWQANRLIKGGHVCFLCPIPSPEQTLPYLRSAACTASMFPSPVRGWGGLARLDLKNVCLIEKFRGELMKRGRDAGNMAFLCHVLRSLK